MILLGNRLFNCWFTIGFGQFQWNEQQITQPQLEKRILGLFYTKYVKWELMISKIDAVVVLWNNACQLANLINVSTPMLLRKLSQQTNARGL